MKARIRIEHICLLLSLIVLYAYNAGNAQLSPGDLAEPHAELEGITNCTKCHELGEGPSAAKCLSCHTEIKNLLDSQKGYHFRVVKKEAKACFACHSDHGGRDFELIHWETPKESFNHDLTGYTLSGKHKELKCGQCHRPDFISSDFVLANKNVSLERTHLGLSEDCLSCHRDEHRNQLGGDCLKCHTTAAWKPAQKFSHERSEFLLKGAHRKVACEKCHKPLDNTPLVAPAGFTDTEHTKFKGLDFANCIPCHTDPHRNTLGSDCVSCHNNKAWKPANGFDHDKTKFPLTGKHTKVECLKCHKNVVEDMKVAGDKDPLARYAGLKSDNCSDCHKDVHENSLGPNCKSCHNTTGWKDIADGKFDHAKTKFPLLGLHSRTPCEKCHTGKNNNGNAVRVNKPEHARCDDCHRDPHHGQFADSRDGGLCESCHDENGFIPALFSVEEHAKTKFPLNGAHLAQPCIVCHTYTKPKKGGKYRIFDLAGEKCEDCHKDPHAAQFVSSEPVKQCADCHTEDSWQALAFDHNRDSQYRLEGAHAKTECSGCHKIEKINVGGKQKIKAVRYRPLRVECRDCHSLKTLELLGAR